MSFRGFKQTVEKGDTVILFLTINQVYNVQAELTTLSKKGTLVENIFQTPYGALKGAELIGKEFGSKIHLSRGWGYILQPTSDLWTFTLPHRTQIIYTPDISMIILQLELVSGSIVIESGTGSGSLSHALIKAIKPYGHLYTFDFHEARREMAENEFKIHGLEEFVTVKHQDVCANGFGSDLNGTADAVFLDLPHPWLAIPHALKSMKDSGGRLCSFSPCIEQVHKTCLALSEQGFQEIQTVEVLQMEYSVQTRSLPIINVEFVKTEKTESDQVKPEKETVKLLTSVPPSIHPGHSGYLSFATLPPCWAKNLISLNEEENKYCTK